MSSTVKVRFHEVDVYGHVNHAVYLHYFEQARVELLETLGCGLTSLAEEGFHLVVVEAHVRYLVPAVSDDVLTVHTTIEQVRPASSRWRQWIERAEGEVLVTNELRAAITDRSGRPTRGPQRLMHALSSLQDD